jgi:hypothetical protein
MDWGFEEYELPEKQLEFDDENDFENFDVGSESGVNKNEEETGKNNYIFFIFKSSRQRDDVMKRMGLEEIRADGEELLKILENKNENSNTK